MKFVQEYKRKDLLVADLVQHTMFGDEVIIKYGRKILYEGKMGYLRGENGVANELCAKVIGSISIGNGVIILHLELGEGIDEFKDVLTYPNSDWLIF